MHILVVEDERILCETIARSLKRLAYSVDCCYDGITAMQMLADDNFDLVVLDLNLPDQITRSMIFTFYIISEK